MTVRPIRIEGDVAYVPLTKGYEAIIDAADVPLVEGFNWLADIRKTTVYAQRTGRVEKKRTAVFLHRCLLEARAGTYVDHADGDGLNNRRANLRLATPSQNMHNMRTSERNTSGFKGVSWQAARGKWAAKIKMNRKQRHLGHFDTREDAAAAYAKASAELHGEFGRVA